MIFKIPFTIYTLPISDHSETSSASSPRQSIAFAKTFTKPSRNTSKVTLNSKYEKKINLFT